MFLKQAVSKTLHGLRTGVVALTVLQLGLGGPFVSPAQAQPEPQSRTPIKHVIIIVGENRTFDHIFATYKPHAGESVDNLLSKGIITPPLFHSSGSLKTRKSKFETRKTKSRNTLMQSHMAVCGSLAEENINISPKSRTKELTAIFRAESRIES